MKITLAQVAPSLNRSNIERYKGLIEDYSNSSDLIVFPELALNGYMLQDKLYEDAWEISELRLFETLSQNIDIAIGAAMRDKQYFRNAALYFSKGKFIHRHNKVYLPNYGMFEEARYFTKGESFEVFTINGLRVAMLVCEDLWHVDMHSQLSIQKPDLILALVASPARGFQDDILLIQDQWYTLIKSAAIHSKAKVIFVNRVGFEDGLGFWGGSCIVNEDGTIQNRLPLYDSAIATFEIRI